jgi:putative ABC transport system ATP-binding protein
MQPSAILSVQDLGRQVNQRWIWQNLTFAVYPGDRLAVIGASGTGKSLMLRAIAGLDPVQQGQIDFAGQPLTAWDMPAYRARVMYLHQRPVLPEGSVEQMLCQVYTFKGHRHARYDRDRIIMYLNQLGRSDRFLDLSTRSLSGGESQLAAFLRALQLSPTLLLLDEPTASLDPDTAHQVEQLVVTWQAEDAERAYLWTSHSPEQLQRITDRAIALSPSMESADGTPVH